MGLSSKQVTSDHDYQVYDPNWSFQSPEVPKPPPATARRQNHQQPPERLNCPRCDSTNTKFCYYNNYNKSQPRHFCKSCKRHWTKGGTLRNVPVGGARKNKRHRPPPPPQTTATRPQSLVQSYGENNAVFSRENLFVPENELSLQFSLSSNSNSNNSTRSSNNIGVPMQESVLIPAWELGGGPNLMEMEFMGQRSSTYWNWNEEFDHMIGGSSGGFNIGWDIIEKEIKP